VESWLEIWERFFEKWGKQLEMDSREERSLKRATIVEKWWHGKIKKEEKQSEKLWKEVKPGEVEKR
jgi:hypothetical protein